jgi:hypothetical protein
VEVFYVRSDGMRVRGWAYQSFRTIPSRWMVGDTPLSEVKQISKSEWMLGCDGPDWVASAEAMIR